MREPLEIIASLGRPQPKGVLQVGASIGQEIPYFAQRGLLFGAFIEPLDGPFSVLVERCRPWPGYVPVQALCGARDGQSVEFHVASNNGESSSILRPARHLTDYPWVHFPQTVTMQTFTLDRVFAALAAQRPEVASVIDLLFMDVQGAELEVVKGANTVLNQAQYIYTEVGIGGGYEDSVELIDLQLFLRQYGYKLYELEMNAEGWGNAMFIKG